MVGEGMVTIEESVPNEKIRMKLEFIKPLPNTAEVEFTFKEQDGKTVVTWTMNSTDRDFTQKALGLIMPVGSSFEQGLASLKSVVEKENKK